MRAFVRTWRESRDHAFELFDVVLDVVSRVPMLKRNVCTLLRPRRRRKKKKSTMTMRITVRMRVW